MIVGIYLILTRPVVRFSLILSTPSIFRTVRSNRLASLSSTILQIKRSASQDATPYPALAIRSSKPSNFETSGSYSTVALSEERLTFATITP